MKKTLTLIISVLVLGILAASAFFAFRYFSEQKAEQAFRSLYGSHYDFNTVYSVIKENKALLAKNSRHDGALDSLAQGYYVLGALDEARDAILKATELRSDNDAYWSRLGQIYQRRKEYPLAASAYEKALLVNPKKKEHYKNLAWLYYFRSEGEDRLKAFPVLERGLKAFPKDQDLLFDITRYYLYDKNAKEFLKYAPRYLAVNPQDKAMQKDYESYKKQLKFKDKKK